MYKFVHSISKSMENTVLESILAATLFLPGLHSISKSGVCAGKKYSLLSGPGFAWYPLKACTHFQLTCPINTGRNCFVPLFLLPKLNVLSSGKEFNPPVRGTSFTALFYMPREALLNYASALSSQQREVSAYGDQRSPFPWCPSGL